MTRMRGRTALVTGGAGAIGLATVRRLAREGARVVVADLDERHVERVASELRGAGHDAVGAALDVTDHAAVADLPAKLTEHGLTVDILVCAHGVLVAGSATETSLEDWRRTMDVNVTGTFLVARAVLPGMVERGRGSIVLVSSTAGVVAEAGIAAYCASKGAVLMLGRQLAVDYARAGIRVNVLCPGWIDTPFNDPAIERAGGREALAPFIEQMVPLGRQGEPDEVADVIAFLASDDARYMTGSVVLADGGLTAM